MKTITENRKEFIKNNNIIVKVNNYDELCDVLDILDANGGGMILTTVMQVVSFDLSKYYVLHIPQLKQIIITKDYKDWEKSKILIHEFPTRNFIDAFMD